MWTRIKNIVSRCLSVVAALCVLGLLVIYMGVTTLLATGVVNDLRFDTYVTYDTGFALVLLVFLLGWIPAWVIRSYSNRR